MSSFDLIVLARAKTSRKRVFHLAVAGRGIEDRQVFLCELIGLHLLKTSGAVDADRQHVTRLQS